MLLKTLKTQNNVYLAVDAENLFLSLGEGTRIDYQALINFAQTLGETVVESAIYVPFSASNRERREPFLRAMKMRVGFTRVVTRLYRERHGRNGELELKSDLDTSIIIDLLEAAIQKQMDLVVLVSGDSDFIPLVERLVDWGVRVYVIGPDGSTNPELITAATWFCHASDVPGLFSPATSTAVSSAA